MSAHVCCRFNLKSFSFFIIGFCFVKNFAIIVCAPLAVADFLETYRHHKIKHLTYVHVVYVFTTPPLHTHTHRKHFEGMFPNEQDRNFSESVSGCIWPRAAIAAGSFWGYNNNTKGLDEATFDATQQRLLRRGIPSCPCATLTSNGCSQMQRCEKSYCPPPPPPPPPPSCGETAPWKCLFAVACDESDPDQAINFDKTTGQIKSASGLCVDAVGCTQVPILALAVCNSSAPTQTWAHSNNSQFTSVGCAGQCIDCYNGGTGNAGLWTCDTASNQAWVPVGHTFGEDYAGKKCMSQAPAK